MINLSSIQSSICTYYCQIFQVNAAISGVCVCEREKEKRADTLKITRIDDEIEQ